MYQVRISLKENEKSLLDKIVEKTGETARDLCKERIRSRYFELYPIRKVAEVIKKPEVFKTRKQFLEYHTHGMDVDESRQWHRDHKLEADKYPL